MNKDELKAMIAIRDILNRGNSAEVKKASGGKESLRRDDQGLRGQEKHREGQVSRYLVTANRGQRISRRDSLAPILF